jgi:hypothetical protein
LAVTPIAPTAAVVEELDKVSKGEVTLAEAATKVIAGRRHSHSKESRIPDPLGAFVYALGLLCKESVKHYAELGASVKEKPELVKLYKKCYGGLRRITAVVEACEATLPSFIDLADSLKSSIRQTSDYIDLPTPGSRF